MTNLFINRDLKDEIISQSRYFPVITITGPRQSGKTTLCKQMFPDYHYVNLEDIAKTEIIKQNPKAFLEIHSQGLIVDEAQQYPDLFSYVQVVVDENPDSHIVLTGSSNFALLQSVTQSLAGRTAVLTLLPLSLSELGKERLTAPTDTIMLNGGYPSVWAKNIPVQTVSKNYYNTYIERDLRQLINIKELSKYQVFIRLCAGRTGTEFNASALSNEVGVSVPTIHEWLSTLEASYIVFRISPFFRNVGKRLIKSPKIYFYDTGLLCFLLGIENENHLQTHPLRGAIFENMVVLEFLKNRFNAGKLSNLYFYRDKSQREIDIVQEFADTFKAYEIKSASVFHPNFMHNLNYLKNLLNEKLTSTQVIYDGEIELKSSKNGIVNFRNISF
ncbi:MAG: ATP-binding protein [Bacteroidota bacterium]|jgi:predicted AAA+ superfamily ATPase|nr:ATP-binding protein [Bacteroidota bacterium]